MWLFGFQLAVFQRDLDIECVLEMGSNLVRNINGTMLTTGATQRYHEVRKVLFLVAGHCRVDNGIGLFEKTVHFRFSTEIVYYFCIIPGQVLVLDIPARVGQKPAIEDKASSMATLINGNTLLEGKAVYANTQLQFRLPEFPEGGRLDDLSEHRHHGGDLDGQIDMGQQIFQIPNSIGDTLQEMGLAFIEAAIAIGTHGLHDAYEDEGVIVLRETFAFHRYELGESIQVEFQPLLAQFERQISLGIEEQRGNVVLQGAFAASLVIDEPGTAVPYHDVPGLEITVEKMIAVSLQQEIREHLEVIFQVLLIELDMGQLE